MDGDRLVIHASTQVPWHLRRIVARVLGIGENRVRVIKERIGGGYGSKQDILLEEVCAFATLTTGRSVFHKYTREEEFVAATVRHPFRVKVKMGARRDGTLTAIRMSVDTDTGAYGNHCLTVPMNACSKSLPLFRCANLAFEVSAWYTNHVPSGAYQGYGAPQGSFAVQMAAAEVAAALRHGPGRVPREEPRARGRRARDHALPRRGPRGRGGEGRHVRPRRGARARRAHDGMG